MSCYRNVLLPKCLLPKRPFPKSPLPKCLDTVKYTLFARTLWVFVENDHCQIWGVCQLTYHAAICVVDGVGVTVVKAAAVKPYLHVCLDSWRRLRPALCKHTFLLGRSESKTGARHGKLNEEQQEQDDHVLAGQGGKHLASSYIKKYRTNVEKFILHLLHRIQWSNTD